MKLFEYKLSTIIYWDFCECVLKHGTIWQTVDTISPTLPLAVQPCYVPVSDGVAEDNKE